MTTSDICSILRLHFQDLLNNEQRLNRFVFSKMKDGKQNIEMDEYDIKSEFSYPFRDFVLNQIPYYKDLKCNLSIKSLDGTIKSIDVIHQQAKLTKMVIEFDREALCPASLNSTPELKQKLINQSRIINDENRLRIRKHFERYSQNHFYLYEKKIVNDYFILKRDRQLMEMCISNSVESHVCRSLIPFLTNF